jgi:MFS family permease
MTITVFNNRPVLLLAIAQTLIWACLYYSFPALLLHWEEAFGWSRADLTAAITLAIIISALAAPFSGRLIDAGRGPMMMALSCACGGLSLLALSLVDQLWQFYLCWGAIGLCMGGCLYEPCFALITRAKGSEAKPAIIAVTLIAGFAGTLSFPSVHLIEAAFGWRAVTLVFSAICIFVVTPLMWFGASAIERDGLGRQISAGDDRQTNSFLHSPVFWCLAFGVSFGALLHGVTLHHLLPILNERQVSSDYAVLLISLIGPMQVAGRLAMIATGRFLSNHGITIACFILMGASIGVLIVAEQIPALLILFVILFGGSYGIVSIIRPVIARELLGDRQFGAKSGALALVYLSGSASAPFLGALLWSIGGYALVLPCLMLLAMVGLGLYMTANHLVQVNKKAQENPQN